MKNTYNINPSSIKLNNSKKAKKVYRKNLIRKFFRILFCAFIGVSTVILVFYIFHMFDSKFLIGNTFYYSESITLGALVSTLGSSLISITSIWNEQCSKNVDLNIKTLQEDQLERDRNWNRWPFTDRVSKHKLTKDEYEYYIYKNPSIKFNVLKKEIFIPISIKDFNELNIMQTYFILSFKRNEYRKLLAFQPTSDYLKDILIWDCMKDVYKHIFLYKCCKIISLMGWSIVISSIIFSFFYPQLIGYLDSIILTVSAIWS